MRSSARRTAGAAGGALALALLVGCGSGGETGSSKGGDATLAAPTAPASPEESPASAVPSGAPEETPATSEAGPRADRLAALASGPGAPLRGPALQALYDVIQREAGKPGNAWALAHGVLAMGPEFEATDGRRAVHVIVDDFLKAEKVDQHKGLQPYFPNRTAEGLPLEPHTDLILKTLLEVGLPLDEALTPKEGAPTLERLFRGSRVRYEPLAGEGEEGFTKPDDVAWSIQAWCQGVQAGAAPTWQAAGLKQADLGAVTEQQLELLESTTWFMRQAMEKGETVQKRRQGIFAYTCGGAHLHQSVVACAAAGWPKDRNVEERLALLNQIYVWRIPLETSLVEQAMKQAPQLAPLLYNQDVKFLGHALESLGKAERDGLWTPAPEARALLDDAEARLVAHVQQMNKLGIYREDKLANWMQKDDTRQFYLDVVGDAAHAWHALEIQAELRKKRAGG